MTDGTVSVVLHEQRDGHGELGAHRSDDVADAIGRWWEGNAIDDSFIIIDLFDFKSTEGT